jgi:hypothetical protein
MSRNALEGKRPHTYIDDLESFYFVLCWILMVYSGPHKPRAAPPKQAVWWDISDSFTMKQGHFGRPKFHLPVDAWFGPCFSALAARLYDFFLLRDLSSSEPVPPNDPKQDYDKYLGHIRQCIIDLEAEDLAAEQGRTSLPGEPDSPSQPQASLSGTH